MAKASIFLNFPGNAEEAFTFYKSVFNTEFSSPLMRMSEVPSMEGMPPLLDSDKNKVMHVALPILGGLEIMGSDNLESMGHQNIIGNNTTINLEPDTLEETQRLFDLFSKEGSQIAPLMEQFWGAIWGCCLDKYGIRWMFNFYVKKG